MIISSYIPSLIVPLALATVNHYSPSNLKAIPTRPNSPSKLCNPPIPTRPQIYSPSLITTIHKLQRPNCFPLPLPARMLAVITNLLDRPTRPDIADANRRARRQILGCSQKSQLGMYIDVEIQFISVCMGKCEQRLRPIPECLMIELSSLCRVAIAWVERAEVVLVVVVILVVECFAGGVSN